MKEKMKRAAAGFLAAIIALGVPANLQKADASAHNTVCGRIREERKEDRKNEPDIKIPAIELETAEYCESILEDLSMESQETTSEMVLEDISEDISGENQETTSEIESKENSEENLEEKLETISILMEEVTGSDSISSNKRDRFKVSLDNTIIVPEITDEGVFDYRTYLDSDTNPQLRIFLWEKVQDRSIRPKMEINDLHTNLIPKDELSDIDCQVTISDTNVVLAADESEGTFAYNLSSDAMKLVVNGVGETDYEIVLLDNDRYGAAPVSGSIMVENSPLYNDDFYIEMSGTEKRYTFDEWEAYLEAHAQWANGEIRVRLSDIGKKYYNTVKINAEETGGRMDNRPIYDSKKRKYVFWAENADRNASTKNVENGTRVFTAGIDNSAPLLQNFVVESECFAPTKTDTEQYFGQDFVLKGRFVDFASGVKKVEYTTDNTLDKDAVWAEAETMPETDTGSLDFSITLRDGRYNAVAVRAYDYAGNVSETKGFVNENGAYIKVIVDKSEPVMNIKATADNKPYIGDNDSWTNKDIAFDISFDMGSCPYAGVYQCAYLYETIGDAVNNNDMTNMSNNWTGLKIQGNQTASLEVGEDKNGYYCFRAISKSGITSKEIVKKRVLTQHQAPEIKPIIVDDVDHTKRKNNWYNKESGAPVIHFAYPDYDTGVTSKEYDAPVTIHYQLTAETDGADKSVQQNSNYANAEISAKNTDSYQLHKSAQIGVMSCSDVSEGTDGVRTFVLTQDDLDKHVIDFRNDTADREIQDGVYTLEYWITDKAGNVSDRQKTVYKIDSHEPENLKVELEGSEFPVSQTSSIVYEKFYRNNVSGVVSAQYGISGKGSLTVLKAKRIGEWEKAGENGSFDISDTGVINIPPCTRCFLYVKAEDKAGNVAEGWTRGIVVDDMAPNQERAKELIIEPAGANQNGFFNADIRVDINVKDAPEDENCAALMTVSGTVGKDGKDTFTDRELFSFTKEFPTDEELINASGFSTVQVVNAKVHESNAAYIEVTATDRSGNTKTSTQMLKIDVTKPQIEITFDNDNAVNGNFYNAARTAAIQIQERNFDPSTVHILVTKDGQAYDCQMSDWTSDGDTHSTAIVFAEDGTYMMEVSCTDLADNESDIVKIPSFTIDRTAPVLTIELDSGQDRFFHENYYNTAVTAVITVIERNFSEDGFSIDNVSASKKGIWSHNGNVHTIHFTFDGDSAYHIVCSYTDLAGNKNDPGNPADKSEADFVIDTIAPMIFIEGITDGSANCGAVCPVISVLDFNMETQDTVITVTTGVGDIVQNTIETAALNEENGIGYRFTLSDMTDKEDNIYYLTVSTRDKAGNESVLTYRFSLNRKGSAYDLAQITDLMERQYITYTDLEDIQIVEMNIDTVEHFAIYISRNGALGYSAVYDKEIMGSAEKGYTYVYRIKKDNFAEEGTYRISLYSRDRVGNEVNNTTDIHGDKISFIIDNTPPKVVVDGVETGMLYDVESQQVRVSVTDNFKLSEAELVLVNKTGDVIDSWDYMELCGEGEQMDITIAQCNEELALLYRVKDAAGNEIQTFQGEQEALADFLVTTDKLVQFINKPSKTPYGRIVLALTGAAMLVTAMTAAMLLSRQWRRRYRPDTL